MTYPDNNLKLRGLVDCERRGMVYQQLESLRREVLRPSGPLRPRYTSVRDIHLAIMEIVN